MVTVIPELPEEGWAALLAHEHRKLSGQLVQIVHGSGVLGVFDYIQNALDDTPPGTVFIWAWHGQYRTNVFALSRTDLEKRYVG